MMLFTQSDLDTINNAYDAYNEGYFTALELYKVIKDTTNRAIELDDKLYQENM